MRRICHLTDAMFVQLSYLAEQQARHEVQRLDVHGVRQLVAILRQLTLAAREDARVVDQAVDVVEPL